MTSNLYIYIDSKRNLILHYIYYYYYIKPEDIFIVIEAVSDFWSSNFLFADFYSTKVFAL